MALNRFLPDEALVWKEWRNNRPVFFIFLGLVTLGSSIQLARQVASWELYGSMPLPNSFNMGFFFDVASALVTVFVAAIMVGREREQNTLNLLLAMPYSRRRIIYNKFVAGLAQLPLILGLNALIMSTVLSTVPDIGLSLGAVWAWALQCTLILGFIFAFSMLVATISGTIIGAWLLSSILLLFPYGFTILLGANIPPLWNSPDIIRWLDITALLTPLLYFSSGVQNIYPISQPLVYCLYLALTYISYIITQYAFIRNPVENNGAVLMFEQLEGFFKVGVTVCFSLLAGVLMHEFVYRLRAEGLFFRFAVYLLAGAGSWFLATHIIRLRKQAG